MTRAESTVREIIDQESVGPRVESRDRYLAVSGFSQIPVARTDLLYIWDDYHREYLDFAQRDYPLGYRHPKVLNAVNDHLRYYLSTSGGDTHLLRWPVEYARNIVESLKAPDGEELRVLWAEGERDAVRIAVGLTCPDRTVAILDTGWHDWLATERSCRRVDPAFYDDDQTWDGVDCLLMTSVTTGMEFPDNYLPVVAAARARGIPVVFDESVTGFGRTGSLWGQHQAGIVPDLTVLGGPVGGGLPLGAVVATEDWLTDIPSRSPQAGNPLACCAGSMTLALVSVGAIDHVQDTAKVLADNLGQVTGQFPEMIEGHHGRGVLQALRLSYPSQAPRLVADCLSQGLHLPAARNAHIPVNPALICSTTEISRGVDIIAGVLMDWQAEFA